MLKTPDLEWIAAQYLEAICADDLNALKKLVLSHGTEIDLVYEHAGRSTQVQVRGSPLAIAACLKRDTLAAFLVKKGASHGYALHSCRTASFTHTQSVVPMQMAALFGLVKLCSALMDAGCVDWLEHNYSEDSEAGYRESSPLLLTLSSSEQAVSLIEALGTFRGMLGSRFVEVVDCSGDLQVNVDHAPQRRGLPSMKEALEWVWERFGRPELLQYTTA